LKYYKHATPPYWKLILEQNQDLLEGNERNLREGMELEIPELPEDLKD
jgi:nitrogen fixation protein